MATSPTGRGYSTVLSVAQYSAAVAADAGHALHRRALDPLPLDQAVPVIVDHLRQVGASPQSLCSFELRSPEPRSEQGFRDFNRAYRAQLEDLELLLGEDNPVGRTNVCDVDDSPADTVVHAFSYCLPEQSSTTPTFVVSGSAEVAEGLDAYAAHAEAAGNTSPSGMRTKAEWVLAEMERRMGEFGAAWQHCTAVQVYTGHLSDDLRALICDRVGSPHRITFHHSLPPVIGLDFEMDCRSVLTDQPLG